MRGVFRSHPIYDEGDPRWVAEANIEGTDDTVSVWLFDMGITPDRSGERWNEVVTIPEDQQ